MVSIFISQHLKFIFVSNTRGSEVQWHILVQGAELVGGIGNCKSRCLRNLGRCPFRMCAQQLRDTVFRTLGRSFSGKCCIDNSPLKSAKGTAGLAREPGGKGLAVFTWGCQNKVAQTTGSNPRNALSCSSGDWNSGCGAGRVGFSQGLSLWLLDGACSLHLYLVFSR